MANNISAITTSAPAAAAVPVGTIVAYAGTVAPEGWLLCDGSEVSRTIYADLFDVIGTTYGAGDGETTFNLPDLRARFPIGLHSGKAAFDTLGEVGGSETQTLAVANLPSHSHTFSGTTSVGGDHTHGLVVSETPGGYVKSIYCIWSPYASIETGLVSWLDAHSHTYSGTTSAEGGGSAFSIMNPYLVVNYIIKY